jgi:hypothetical protein
MLHIIILYRHMHIILFDQYQWPLFGTDNKFLDWFFLISQYVISVHLFLYSISLQKHFLNSSHISYTFFFLLFL